MAKKKKKVNNLREPQNLFKQHKNIIIGTMLSTLVLPAAVYLARDNYSLRMKNQELSLIDTHRSKELEKKDIRVAELKKEISSKQEEIASYKNKHPIFQNYGHDFWGYQKFKVKNEPDDYIEIRTPENELVYKLQVSDRLYKDLDPPKYKNQVLWVAPIGSGFGITEGPKGQLQVGQGGKVGLMLPFTKGATRDIITPKFTFRIIVEDDRVNSLAVGVAIKETKESYTGMRSELLYPKLEDWLTKEELQGQQDLVVTKNTIIQ